MGPFLKIVEQIMNLFMEINLKNKLSSGVIMISFHTLSILLM
jgi:hypothetical protein